MITSNLLIWSTLGLLLLFGMKNRKSFQPVNISSWVITSFLYFSFALPIFFITAVMLAVSSEYIDVQGFGVTGTIFYFPLFWMVIFSASVFIISFLSMAGDLKIRCKEKRNYFFWLQALSKSILPKVIIFGLVIYIITSLVLIPMRRDFNRVANLAITNEIGLTLGERPR